MSPNAPSDLQARERSRAQTTRPSGPPATTGAAVAAADWCRALDLGERAARFAAAVHRPADPEAARRRYDRWRETPAFAEARVFAGRLALDGLDDDDFLRLLATPAERFAAAGEPPSWLAELEAAYATAAGAPPPIVAGEGVEGGGWGFHGLLAPLISRGVERVERGAQRLAERDPAVPFDPLGIVPQLAHTLARRLYEMVEKTLILELNVARLRGELAGATPEQRYASFVAGLERPQRALAILAEYPVLARQAVETIDRWVGFSLEFLGHLAADHRDLAAAFGDLGRLTTVDGGAGDSHRGGRTVQVLAFDGGLRLVYKPRPLGVERHFQELLAWLNERGDHPPFRTLEVLDRGDHGWCEHVETGGCATRGEVERFYRRQGGFLAVLYALEANDFHFQNVLAAGEHPVLVDLESLFQQRVIAIDADSAAGRASTLIAYSVIRTGLLPQFAWRDDSRRPLELSGLGGAGGQVDAGARAMADGGGTDEMRMVHREVEFPGGRNRPTLAGEAVSALDFADAIEAGFESVYRTLLAHRGELTAPGGPIAAFADDQVRVILRHTQFYRLFMLDCFHPDLQRDALDRDRHLDRLWIGAEHRPEIGLVAPLEAAQLRDLDVPIFLTSPGSRDLVSGCGRRVADHFDEPGLDIVRRRLATLSGDDLERQRWMIGASLRALGTAGPAMAPRGADLDAVEPASRERLVAAASKLGDRLATLALVGRDGEASWVGITAIDDSHFMPAPLGPDLYGGLAGITLFLARLAELSGEERHRRLAAAAWRTVVDRLDEATAEGAEMGAYLGTGGLLYTALHLARIWRDPAPLAPLGRLLDHLEAAIGEDRVFDVLGGSAGCIPVLLAAHRQTGERRARGLALACGEHLLATAREVEPRGVAWPAERTGGRPLSGLSHGSAGVAWALLLLAAECGDARFAAAAERTLDYEATLFDAERGNWRDLRGFLGPEGGFSVAWCNGAAGIALARLACLDLVAEGSLAERLRGDLQVALATTERTGFAFNHSLCHGALGNLEPLAAVARRRSDAAGLRRVGQAAAVVCGEVEEGHYHCGVPGGFETPGLFDGLAGIGYGLLRLADPAAVPDVLRLEAPRPA